MSEETKDSEFVTFGDLVKYTQDTLLPALDERFEKMATKDDLKEFAKKEDLKKFATKDDLAKVEDKVLTALDENSKLLKDWREEQDATSTANVRQDETLDDYGKRIVRLEKKTGIKQAITQS